MADILLVEDTPILSELYNEALCNAGYQVTVAETGLATRRILRQKTPDLILLDLQLPDNNGLDLFQEIKATFDQNLPQVIVVTAYSTINLAVDAMREGAYDFLAKPFPIERLLVTVKNALSVNQLNSLVRCLQTETERFDYYGESAPEEVIKPLWMMERNAIEQAVELCKGDVNLAAEMLEISPLALFQKRLGKFEPGTETASSSKTG